MLMIRNGHEPFSCRHMKVPHPTTIVARVLKMPKTQKDRIKEAISLIEQGNEPQRVEQALHYLMANDYVTFAYLPNEVQSLEQFNDQLDQALLRAHVGFKAICSEVNKHFRKKVFRNSSFLRSFFRDEIA